MTLPRRAGWPVSNRDPRRRPPALHYHGRGFSLRATLMHLAGLYHFPIKSSAPLAVETALMEARGLQHDRRWMVVDAEGRFLTGRELPRLTLVKAQPLADGLFLQAPGMAPLRVPFPASSTTLPVKVWKSDVAARPAGMDADAWLSGFLQRPARLVHMDADVARPIASTHSMPGDEVSFADAFPMLLVSQAALDQLNARLARPVSMLRFRRCNLTAGCCCA